MLGHYVYTSQGNTFAVAFLEHTNTRKRQEVKRVARVRSEPFRDSNFSLMMKS